MADTAPGTPLILPTAELLGQAPSIVAVREQIRRIVGRTASSARQPPILLQGETGTGKGLVARTIHRASARRDAPFVDVNCAAIPGGLLEAELFGFERGAFTDARQAKAGLFQSAHGGTIFLDEIALLPEALQAKLLKAIEERCVRRLGATRSEPVDVSIVAATNEDLAAAVTAGRFRQDLYHRLAVVTLRLPALRDRAEDIPLLAEHFLERACKDYGLAPRALTPAAHAALRAYRWPGNVRELANTMERAALLTEDGQISAEALALPVADASSEAMAASAADASLPDRVEALEREELLRALRETRGNVVQAAARLGITRGTIRYRMEKYGLERARHRTRGRGVAGVPVAAAPSPSQPAAPARWETRLVALLAAMTPADFGRDLDLVVQKVESFGGRVEEAGAARLIAAFGAELAEDAPRRAALAAMAIRNARATGAGPAMTIAIHAESCPVRHVGTRAEIDAEARRRMMALLDEVCRRGDADVLVTPATRSLLAPRFDFEEQASAPNVAIRLRGYAPFAGGVQPAPFVGRDDELGVLRGRWDEARGGRGQIVALIGEAGIGKSRLLFEFRRSLRPETVTYLEGRGQSYGAGIPYLPVVDLLRSFFRIEEHDEPAAAAGKIRHGLLAVDPALEADLSPFLALLDAPGGDPQWSTLDPAERRQRTLEALRRLVLRLSQDQPVLLAIEDLHWIDAETQAFLDRLIASVAAARLLVLVTSRPEYRPSAGGDASYTQLHVDPLAPASAEALVRALLGDHSEVQPLARMLLERTEGHPFFLEESIRTLIETAVLVGERGAYRPAASVPALEVPPTVRAVLAARVGRLAPATRSVLQAAAVIGKDVPVGLLSAVVGVPEAALRLTLTDLQSAEFLRETRLLPEIEYTFKHALTAEVAYDTLAVEDRRALHGRTLEAFERAYGDRIGEVVERLAHHARAAELWDKALAYCRQAGAKAAWRSAHREAVQYFEQAIDAGSRIPETDTTPAETLDLYRQLRWSLVPLGDCRRLAESLRRAAALAERMNDPRQLAEIYQSMANYLRLVGDGDGALDAGRRACALGAELGDPMLEIRATYQLGRIYRQLGDYPRAIEALERVAKALRGDLRYERFGEPSVLSSHALTHLAIVLAEIGRFADAIALAEESVQIATEARNTFSEGLAYGAAGAVDASRGDLARALPELERSLALNRDFPLNLPGAASALGAALTEAGRVDDAVPLLREAVDIAIARGLVGGCALHYVRLGWAVLRAGRIDEAREQARRALDLARTKKERASEARALHLLGEVAARAGSPERAAGHYSEALALAETLGMKPFVTKCRESLETGAPDGGRHRQTI